MRSTLTRGIGLPGGLAQAWPPASVVQRAGGGDERALGASRDRALLKEQDLGERRGAGVPGYFGVEFDTGGSQSAPSSTSRAWVWGCSFPPRVMVAFLL